MRFKLQTVKDSYSEADAAILKELGFSFVIDLQSLHNDEKMKMTGIDVFIEFESLKDFCSFERKCNKITFQGGLLLQDDTITIHDGYMY